MLISVHELQNKTGEKNGESKTKIITNVRHKLTEICQIDTRLAQSTTCFKGIDLLITAS